MDGGAVSADEERLMQLFQNRAGLKKAYADLKDEFHLLRDRLKQQEGATIRVQEQLDALGDLLGDPKTGFGALVFFQLRHLAEAQNEIGRLTAIWHYFKRRRRQKSLEVLRSHVVVADAAAGDLHAERSAIEREAAP